ncbi:MAG: hypothetical protein JWR45_3872, partial [Blastococcus sp.]|nr:hypothetical protein [Blastococcus sp.]
SAARNPKQNKVQWKEETRISQTPARTSWNNVEQAQQATLSCFTYGTTGDKSFNSTTSHQLSDVNKTRPSNTSCARCQRSCHTKLSANRRSLSAPYQPNTAKMSLCSPNFYSALEGSIDETGESTHSVSGFELDAVAARRTSHRSTKSDKNSSQTVRQSYGTMQRPSELKCNSDASPADSMAKSEQRGHFVNELMTAAGAAMKLSPRSQPTAKDSSQALPAPPSANFSQTAPRPENDVSIEPKMTNACSVGLGRRLQSFAATRANRITQLGAIHSIHRSRIFVCRPASWFRPTRGGWQKRHCPERIVGKSSNQASRIAPIGHPRRGSRTPLAYRHRNPHSRIISQLVAMAQHQYQYSAICSISALGRQLPVRQQLTHLVTLRFERVAV